MNSTPNKVLPVPVSPCTTITFPLGMPPCRISSSPRIPVFTTASPLILVHLLSPHLNLDRNNLSQVQTQPLTRILAARRLPQVFDKHQTPGAFLYDLQQFLQGRTSGIVRHGGGQMINARSMRVTRSIYQPIRCQRVERS